MPRNMDLVSAAEVAIPEPTTLGKATVKTVGTTAISHRQPIADNLIASASNVAPQSAFGSDLCSVRSWSSRPAHLSPGPTMSFGVGTHQTTEATTASKPTVRLSTVPKAGDWKSFGASVSQHLKADEVAEKIDSGHLWVVNSRRRNGLIVLWEFHAEFAGPGAAVGGDLDEDIVKVIPIGNLSLLEPDSHEAHQNAIKIRLQWIRLTQNFTDQPSPDDRARMILEQFKTYFDQATVDQVPDEAFALLVGVLPQTIHRVRSGFVW